MAKFLFEIPNINEGDCLLIFKQNFEHRVCTLVKFFITDGHAAGVECHGPSVMGAGCALQKDLLNSFFKLISSHNVVFEFELFPERFGRHL